MISVLAECGGMINMPLGCLYCGGIVEGLLIMPVFFLIRMLIRWIAKCKICDCPCHKKEDKNE